MTKSLLAMPLRTGKCSAPAGQARSHYQSRPLLLAAVCKAASHTNQTRPDQTTLYLTPLHERAEILKRLMANISAALQHVKDTAEHLRTLDPWGCLCATSATALLPSSGHQSLRQRFRQRDSRF